jgi:hypothetical protein
MDGTSTSSTVLRICSTGPRLLLLLLLLMVLLLVVLLLVVLLLLMLVLLLLVVVAMVVACGGCKSCAREAPGCKLAVYMKVTS